MSTALVSILCEDHAGLIADVTGRMYDLGVNLGDTTFAVLGGGAEFTLVAHLANDVSLKTLEAELKSLKILKGAQLTVAPFTYRPTHDEHAKITHRIEISGDDSPGLIARLSEAFRDFGANIVRLNSESAPSANRAAFVLRLAVWCPDAKAAACMATVANTASQMNLKCHWQAVG